MREYYTSYPRTLLWLVRGGQARIGGDELPRLQVEVEPFYISKFPITNQQFEAFDSSYRRRPNSPGDRDPAVAVSCEEAAGYADWYASVSRKKMRLPTEIEWEYACRAGSEERYSWGGSVQDADEHMWDLRNAPGDRIPPLAEKRPNEFGLYGMLGGVWEWTSSPDRSYPLTEPASGESVGPLLVLRGGSCQVDRSVISCSLRRPARPDLREDDIGFRVVRSFR